MNIAPECGAVKAPLSPIEWRISDRRAVLDLNDLACRYVRNFVTCAAAHRELHDMWHDGRISVDTRCAVRDLVFTLSDAHDLLRLIIECQGGAH